MNGSLLPALPPSSRASKRHHHFGAGPRMISQIFDGLTNTVGARCGRPVSGSWATNDDYSDGSGQKITSTYGQSIERKVTLAAHGAGNLAVLQVGIHHTPYGVL